MRYLIITLIALLSSTSLHAEPTKVLEITETQGIISAQFTLTGTTILLDESGQPVVSPVDQLQATLTVTTPDTHAITLPTFTGATFGDFTLLDQGKTNRKRIEKIVTSTSWLIEPYNAGNYSLPTLTIKGQATNDTTSLTIKLPEITVTGLTATENDFDILPAREITPALPWKLIVAITGGVSILLILAFWLKGKRRPCTPSPKQQALKSLEKLTGNNQENIAQISIIIRQFIDHNFTLCTTEKTFAEYAPFVQKHPQIPDHTKILEILQTCDKCNYSSQQITDKDLASLHNKTTTFIENCAEPMRPEEDSGTCGRW